MTVTVGVAETNYPLAVNFLIDPELGRLQLWLDCDLAVLPEEFCARLAGYYERALAAVARTPEERLTSVDLMAPAEHAQLLAWNDTAVPYDPTDTVHGQFERRALTHPDAIAVAHRFDEVSYAELDSRANRLAHHLPGQGVGRGDLVGVSLRRGVDLVVALLAARSDRRALRHRRGGHRPVLPDRRPGAPAPRRQPGVPGPGRPAGEDPRSPCEPDEVESVLSRHPRLDAVAVTAIDGANGTELVAYVSPADSLSDASVQDAHVRNWGEVWESAYTASEAAPEDGSEFAGWLSSYTGEPIPVPEMREWLGHTVDRIRGLCPTAVADIGVGVGLVLRNLADQVAEYHGVDVSPAALTAAAASLGRPLPAHVHLERSGPEYLARLAPGSLDTVVINSVAQYFPGTDYLRTVLTDAVRAVRPGGAVFVGDVRSVEMLPEFHTAVSLHRAGPLQTVEEIRSAIARRLQEERELCLSPAFFHQLAAELDGIGEVRVELNAAARRTTSSPSSATT
ncbi:hypothetical protein STANM309S_05141 [Streptomyces tanashiensis]